MGGARFSHTVYSFSLAFVSEEIWGKKKKKRGFVVSGKFIRDYVCPFFARFYLIPTSFPGFWGLVIRFKLSIGGLSFPVVCLFRWFLYFGALFLVLCILRLSVFWLLGSKSGAGFHVYLFLVLFALFFAGRNWMDRTGGIGLGRKAFLGPLGSSLSCWFNYWRLIRGDSGIGIVME